ncbi:MAG: ABC transporter permease [Gammaproteobacteria bacterium]
MNASVQSVSWVGLLIAFVPAAVVVLILLRWSLSAGTALYAFARMFLQLLLIGYVLTYVFESEHALLVCGVLGLMLVVSSWIAMRPIQKKSRALYLRTLAAICIGGVSTLILVTQFVLDVQPWYEPRFIIPLAGMIFASAMNAVSLSAERFESERSRGADYLSARNTALQTSLIPLLNTLFAVGLVALPGMMTGQILAGVNPLIAARYQIVVMCMLFGSSGLAAALYLVLARHSEE